LPLDIRWHFVGHLQSNKAKKVLLPNLEMLHTLDSKKLADILNKELTVLDRTLQVLIQVKTSEEDSKYGVDTEGALQLAGHVLKACPALRFSGLMTIGREGDLDAFSQLAQARALIA
jgi:uncharacterized pyridoxal phosphate-containing UPF0001 family protein